MGAGKTTVGARLADELGWNLWDSDDMLQERFGKTAADVERDQGIDHLHQIEVALLTEALDREETVVCSAASVVINREARERMRKAYVVYLRAPVEVLLSRVTSAHDSGRPLLAGDVAKTFTILAREREPFFQEVADLVVDVAGHGPEENAGIIAEHYRRQAAVS